MRIVISSGHGLHVRGASGYLDEVTEARRVVEATADKLRQFGVTCTTFHDNTSTTQEENLNTIVDFHNSHDRDLDVSVHFNAYVETPNPMGVEVLYVTQEQLARTLSADIAEAGNFINRGGKYRGDLFFLNQTDKPAILIETCFVDSKADADLYHTHFDAICRSIAEILAMGEVQPPERPERPQDTFHVQGRCSWFGGPNDHGVSSSEGLAFISSFEDAPHLFLPDQPADTTGLARRLDPGIFYLACRWDYDHTPKSMLRDQSLKALVYARGKSFLAYPADWGPHEDTGRVADLSPALLEALGLQTDDQVEVTYPSSEVST